MDVVEYLKDAGVKFSLRHHPARFTAQEVAAAEHVTGEEVAKVVIVTADEDYIMCVVPATYVLDMDKVRDAADVDEARLATEDEIADLFPDCEVGAMPPFGTAYDLPTYVEESLAEDEEILIPAGTHEDSIMISWDDYEELAEPTLAPLGHHTQ